MVAIFAQPFCESHLLHVVSHLDNHTKLCKLHFLHLFISCHCVNQPLWTNYRSQWGTTQSVNIRRFSLTMRPYSSATHSHPQPLLSPRTQCSSQFPLSIQSVSGNGIFILSGEFVYRMKIRWDFLKLIKQCCFHSKHHVQQYISNLCENWLHLRPNADAENITHLTIKLNGINWAEFYEVGNLIYVNNY